MGGDTATLGVRTTLDAFFTPQRVAVIGAGRRRGAIGAEVFHNLTHGGFRGEVFAVNPHGHTIDGTPASPNVASIPSAIDLAIIAVPSAWLKPRSTRLEARVPAIVVISAGFAETGAAGRERETAIGKRSGRRVRA